jgi:hypothetical protein
LPQLRRCSRAAAAGAIALSAALTACGSGGSPEAEVTKSVRNWTAALSEGDGDAACERMTLAGQRELAGFAESFAGTTPADDCATNVKRFTRKINPQVARQTLDADVADVKVDGAAATVTMANGGPSQLRLVKGGDGEWRIDQAFAHGWRLIGAPNYAQGFR